MHAVKQLVYTHDTLIPGTSFVFRSLGLRPVTQGAAGATSEPSPSNDKPGDDEAEVSLSGRLLEEALRERVRKQKKRSIDEGRKRKESAGEETSGHALVGLLELLRIALGGDGSSGEQKVRLAHSFTYSLTHSLTQSLTHSLNRPPTHPLRA